MSPVFVIFIIIGVLLLTGSFFKVKPATAAIIERLGEFLMIKKEGWHFKVPFIDKIAAKISLQTHKMTSITVETKTIDGLFVKLVISTHLKVLPNAIFEAFYKLENPYEQVVSNIMDATYGKIGKMKLDDIFIRKVEIEKELCQEVSSIMESSGYVITTVSVTAIEWKKSTQHPYNVKKPQHLKNKTS